MKEYLSLNEYLKNTFGCKVYKIALDVGFTCPNRDGNVGRGGCIFCSGSGSGDFTFRGKSIEEQIEDGKKLLSKKADPSSAKYIAYFQAFTNTYAPAEKLESIFVPVIIRDDIAALSIATRPDCLPADVLHLLEKLNRIKPVWVELGLQTSNEEIAKYINRCYENKVYDKAVADLISIGLPQIITHVIIGLPGESKEDMLGTVRYVVSSGSNGIKLQLLHVLKGTRLAEDYAKGLFKTLEMDEYLDIIKECLKIIPPDMVVHRLTGDGAKKDLIAPLWSADKKRVLNAMKKDG
ncbi:MAG: TIGR01212 family radical SAM protein [Lachnospiraceae bacterium]|nr:TIGR01212 family radical SAM protein [Lachnospiraceae bacterium]